MALVSLNAEGEAVVEMFVKFTSHPLKYRLVPMEMSGSISAICRAQPKHVHVPLFYSSTVCS